MRVKTQTTNWEQVYVVHSTDKGFMSRIYVELLPTVRKRQLSKGVSGHFDSHEEGVNLC